jgi:hypothetical protein
VADSVRGVADYSTPLRARSQRGGPRRCGKVHNDWTE